MIKLKDYMTEIEMEDYLKQYDFDVFDEERCIDSTKVIENANLLGYESYLEDDKEFLEFVRISK